MKLYGVFAIVAGRQRWGLTGNKREALKVARKHQGEVRSTDRHAFDGGDQYGIDAPTFRVCSELVQDFRR